MAEVPGSCSRAAGGSKQSVAWIGFWQLDVSAFEVVEGYGDMAASPERTCKERSCAGPCQLPQVADVHFCWQPIVCHLDGLLQRSQPYIRQAISYGEGMDQSRGSPLHSCAKVTCTAGKDFNLELPNS